MIWFIGTSRKPTSPEMSCMTSVPRRMMMTTQVTQLIGFFMIFCNGGVP